MSEHLPGCVTFNSPAEMDATYREYETCICKPLAESDLTLHRCEEAWRIEVAEREQAAWDLGDQQVAAERARIRAGAEGYHRGSCRWYYAERRCSCGLNNMIDDAEPSFISFDPEED